ncbi:MAG: hypothetical protein R3F59_35585 [Myxococcota bacterium]
MSECSKLREKREKSHTTITSKGRGCSTMSASIRRKAGRRSSSKPLMPSSWYSAVISQP